MLSGHADRTSDVGFLDPSRIILTDTASLACCGFDIRMVFQTATRPILVFVSVTRIEAGPPALEEVRKYSFVDHVTFSSIADSARAIARKAADALGADALFLTVHTGNASRVAGKLKARGCPRDLAFLVAVGLERWLPLLSSGPSLATRYTEDR